MEYERSPEAAVRRRVGWCGELRIQGRARDRRRRVGLRHRQLHRLGLRLGERIDLVVDGRVGVATREQPRDPADDANGEHGDLLDVLVSRRR